MWNEPHELFLSVTQQWETLFCAVKGFIFAFFVHRKKKDSQFTVYMIIYISCLNWWPEAVQTQVLCIYWPCGKRYPNTPLNRCEGLAGAWLQEREKSCSYKLVGSIQTLSHRSSTLTSRQAAVRTCRTEVLERYRHGWGCKDIFQLMSRDDERQQLQYKPDLHFWKFATVQHILLQ